MDEHSDDTGKDLQPKPTNQLPRPLKILSEIDSYLSDLECIMEMFEVVTPALIDQDVSRSETVLQIIKELELPAAGNIKDGTTISLKDEALRKLIVTARKLNRAQKLLREAIIVSMVSRYDSFLSVLLTYILQENPHPMYSQEKTLNLKDILELGSTERIRDRFIEKEVERTLRESHADQFMILEKILGIPLTKNLSIFNDFLELAERRNLLVHCGGRISTYYTNKCKILNIDLPPDDSECIECDASYLNTSFAVLFEVGFKLGQTIFRKIFNNKDNLRSADHSLIETGYQLLKKDNWPLAYMVFKYACDLQKTWTYDDTSRKTFTVNLCIAMCNLGKDEEVKRLLDELDWSAAKFKFQLALAVLTKDYDKAHELMKRMKESGEIREEEYREWPLFNDFRNSQQFASAYKCLFDKEYNPLAYDEVQSEHSDSSNLPFIDVETNTQKDT